MSLAENIVEANLKILFGDVQVEKNFRPEWLINPKTNKRLEIDFFLPSLNLAFEVQGPHHITDEYQMYKDSFKREVIPKRGIIFIELGMRDVKLSRLMKILKKNKIKTKFRTTCLQLLPPKYLELDRQQSKYVRNLLNGSDWNMIITPKESWNRQAKQSGENDKKIYNNGQKYLIRRK